MNTVGPYHNRQETYAYFSLPFCVGSKTTINHYHETMSEALQGVELEFSGLDIEFKSKYISLKQMYPPVLLYFNEGIHMKIVFMGISPADHNQNKDFLRNCERCT